MAAVRAAASDGGTTLSPAAETYLLTEPVRHSIFLSMAANAGRFWWATVPPADEVVGFAMQTPAGYSAGVTPCAPEVVDALCDRMMAEVPDLPGVIAEASTAARFAGRWAECRAVPARPVECQRVYRLDASVRPPAPTPGRLRRATPHDRDTLVVWAAGFLAEVGGLPDEDPGDVVDRRLAGDHLWLWDTDGPSAMAAATKPIGGVSRIGFVYTPPERRRKGYATACVAALSDRLLADGADACMLYAQLHNPTSNAIYQRMGYRPVAEILSFRFG